MVLKHSILRDRLSRHGRTLFLVKWCAPLCFFIKMPVKLEARVHHLAPEVKLTLIHKINIDEAQRWKFLQKAIIVDNISTYIVKIIRSWRHDNSATILATIHLATVYNLAQNNTPTLFYIWNNGQAKKVCITFIIKCDTHGLENPKVAKLKQTKHI